MGFEYEHLHKSIKNARRHPSFAKTRSYRTALQSGTEIDLQEGREAGRAPSMLAPPLGAESRGSKLPCGSLDGTRKLSSERLRPGRARGERHVKHNARASSKRAVALTHPARRLKLPPFSAISPSNLRIPPAPKCAHEQSEGHGRWSSVPRSIYSAWYGVVRPARICPSR